MDSITDPLGSKYLCLRIRYSSTNPFQENHTRTYNYIYIPATIGTANFSTVYLTTQSLRQKSSDKRPINIDIIYR